MRFPVLDFGLWAVPAIMSALFFAMAIWISAQFDDDIGFGLMARVIYLGIATICSLSVWCIYFAVT
jgi:hypothetical protein